MGETGRKTRKIYYSMGEVSEMFDVNPSLIRFWEQKFSILKPEKNKKGNRLFTQQDVDNLKLIYHLVKENGMTLAGAQKRLKENREGIEHNLEIIERLQGMKALLLEVRQALKKGDDNAVEIIVGEEMPLLSEGTAVGEEESGPVKRTVQTTGAQSSESDSLKTEESEISSGKIVSANVPVEKDRTAQENQPGPSKTGNGLEASEAGQPVVSVAYPREQPLFPEYAAEEESLRGMRSDDSEEEDSEGPVEAPKSAGKSMQIIEQTLF